MLSSPRTVKHLNSTHVMLGDEAPGLIEINPEIIPVKERNDEVKSLTAGAVIYLIFIFALFTLCLIATGLDYYKQFILPAQLKKLAKAKTAVADSKLNFSTDSVELHSIEKGSSGDKPLLPDSSIPDFIEETKEAAPEIKYSRNEKILLCFSFYTNYKKLFSNRQGNSDPLDSLNGVRVMSTGWVILGHAYINRLIFEPIMNPMATLDHIGSVGSIIFYAAFYSVDTFFWMGGLLMSF